MLRVNNPGSGWNGYQIIVFAQTGTDTWQLHRIIGGSSTTLASGTQEFVAGDRFGLRCIGQRIEIWYQSQGGPWTMLAFANDLIIPKQGRMAIRISSGTSRLDDVYAGTIPPGAIDLPTMLTAIAGETTDAATVYLDLQPSGSDADTTVDSDTVRVKLTPGGSETHLLPPPANDDFANAVTLSTTLPTSSAAQTNQNATFETGEENSFGGSALGDQSVWYKFTPTVTGKYKFRLDNVTLIGTVARFYGISVYTGSAVGSLTRIGRSTITGVGSGEPDHTGLTLNLTSGVTYRIKVWSPIFSGETNPRTISFDLLLDNAATGTAPSNDDIANATDLGTNPSAPVSGDTRFATLETFETSSWLYTEPSVWYRFDVTADANYDMRLAPDPTNDNPDWYPYFEVYEILNDPIVDPDTDLLFLDGSWLPGGIDGWVDAIGFLSTSPPTPEGINLENGKSYLVYVGNYKTETQQGGKFIFYPDGFPDPPVNDSPTGAWVGDFEYPYYLGRSEWGAWWTGAEAGHAIGTTAGATSDVGESPHGGYGPTRSAWYVLDIARDGDYKIWVESAVDCVLSLYSKSGTSVGASIAEDDDSGTGNWPEIVETLTVGDYWIAVDSKAEGTFTLKWERVATGTPPSNDDWANAQVIASFPGSASGTTVDATAEAEEREDENLSSGPKDTVWFKWTATKTGQIQIYATCDTFNDDAYVAVDAWRGSSLDTLERVTTVPSGSSKGLFNHFDTPAEIRDQRLTATVVSGQDLYIRVQTFTGGSEDFTVYIEDEVIYLDLQPGGFEVGPYTDAATVPLRFTITAVIEDHGAVTDAATVYLTITPGATWETLGHETVDTSTVYLNLVALGGECFSRFHFAGEGEADTRWGVVSDLVRWSPDDATRWTAIVESQPGCE